MVVSGTRQTARTTSPTLEITTPLTTNTKRPVSTMCNILTLTSCIKQASNMPQQQMKQQQQQRTTPVQFWEMKQWWSAAHVKQQQQQPVQHLKPQRH